MNIVFDFGGVVFRWRPRVLLQQIMPARAFDDASAQALTAQFFQGFGGDWGMFDRGVIDIPELVQRISTRTGLAPSEVQAVVDAVPDELQPQPDTVDLLKRLHAKGHPLFFLSNMPKPYASLLERSHSFLKCFKDGLFSSRVQVIKPEPAIFELAVQRFGIDPADTVLIDDMPGNVEAARARGWHAIQFRDAAQCEEELKACEKKLSV
jgi:putative hydrolase of the HAD superfamily